jgi:hypothetical protein
LKTRKQPITGLLFLFVIKLMCLDAGTFADEMHRIEIPVAGVAKGLYYLVVNAGTERITRAVMVSE